mmetsp:Transcript_23791/g.43193  ORF Transcript_23791/g.43193 Transcript_23791/m.43193 type:complete len:105 (-) Transcript_23791:37-351(-)
MEGRRQDLMPWKDDDRTSCSSNFYGSAIYFGSTEGTTYYIAIIGQSWIFRCVCSRWLDSGKICVRSVRRLPLKENKKFLPLLRALLPIHYIHIFIGCNEYFPTF